VLLPLGRVAKWQTR